jgi:hypothetical protein
MRLYMNLGKRRNWNRKKIIKQFGFMQKHERRSNQRFFQDKIDLIILLERKKNALYIF